MCSRYVAIHSMSSWPRRAELVGVHGCSRVVAAVRTGRFAELARGFSPVSVSHGVGGASRRRRRVQDVAAARAVYDRAARRRTRRPSPRSEEASVHIEPFFVEQWMNAHETTATWNIAETCVHSLTFDELLEMSGDADGVVRRLKETWLGYGDIVGSPRLRAAIAALYGERITADHVLTANGAIGANFLALYALVEPGTTVVSVQPTYQQLYSVPESLGAEVRAAAAPREGRLPAGPGRHPRAHRRAHPPHRPQQPQQPDRRADRRAAAARDRGRWRASATPGCSATRCTACWSTSRGRRRRRSPTSTRRASAAAA